MIWSEELEGRCAALRKGSIFNLNGPLQKQSVGEFVPIFDRQS